MPVDWIPLALAVAALLSLAVTAVGASRRKKPLLAWLLGLLITALFPVAYLWLYYSTVLLYRGPAHEGDPAAMYALGSSYMHYRRGSPYDPPRGIELLSRAAEKDHVGAQMTLGSFYLTGLSTPLDQDEALRWFMRAKDQGNEDARAIIEIVKRDGFDTYDPTGPAAEIVFKWIYK